MENQFSITIKNELVEIGRVVQLFEEFQEFHNLPEKVGHAVQMALDEIISNIISYAYEDEDEHKINIDVALKERMVTLVIRDDGRPFNPISFSQSKTDTQSSIAERPIGGLGLHLVTTLMDSCEYNYRDGNNCLIMEKKF